jgi:hypothetical protein
MRSIIIILFLVTCFANCKNDSTTIKNNPLIKKTDSLVKIDKYVQNKNPPLKSIQDIEKDSILTAWTDEGSFWLLRFEPNKVIYEFNPSCDYWFPSKIINNEIIFYWALNPNCNFNRGLKRRYKNIANPEIGKPFGKVKIVNDTTLTVNYYYKDWIKKINEDEYKTIDTLFPSKFKKIHL